MSQITIRGIDPEVEKEVRKISKKTGKSLNRVIQEIIYEHIGFDKRHQKAATHSLKKLAGGWSEKEAEAFLESIESVETIDETMWK